MDIQLHSSKTGGSVSYSLARLVPPVSSQVHKMSISASVNSISTGTTHSKASAEPTTTTITRILKRNTDTHSIDKRDITNQHTSTVRISSTTTVTLTVYNTNVVTSTIPWLQVDGTSPSLLAPTTRLPANALSILTGLFHDIHVIASPSLKPASAATATVGSAVPSSSKPSVTKSSTVKTTQVFTPTGASKTASSTTQYPSSSTSSISPTAAPVPGGKKLKASSITGIVIGTLVAAAIVGLLIFLCCKRRRKNKTKQKSEHTGKVTVVDSRSCPSTPVSPSTGHDHDHDKNGQDVRGRRRRRTSSFKVNGVMRMDSEASLQSRALVEQRQKMLKMSRSENKSEQEQRQEQQGQGPPERNFVPTGTGGVVNDGENPWMGLHPALRRVEVHPPAPTLATSQFAGFNLGLRTNHYAQSG